jgi:LysM repeat protein
MEETQKISKKSMSPILVLGVLVILAVLGGAFYLYSSRGSKEERVEQKSVQTAVQNKQKFVDTEDGKKAFKIFPGEMSADAKNALTGFDLKTKNLSNGVTEVTLVAKKQEYTTQTLTVKQGESVYFIEKFGLDDNKNENIDNSLKDDSAFVVDANGYLVK